MSLELLDRAGLMRWLLCVPGGWWGSPQRPPGRGEPPIPCKVPEPASLGGGRAWEDGIWAGYSVLLLLP